MCGFGEKSCAICFYGDGGCVASLREDLYLPASMEDVVGRLDKGVFAKDRKTMKEYLVRNYLYDYDHHRFITVE